jgi:HAE1 family hydrophobic/amphiphilic exporter-1
METKKPTGVNYIWVAIKKNQSEGFGTFGVALLAVTILATL